MAKANEILLKLTAENDQLKAKLNETEKNINNFANKSTTSLGKIQSIATKVGAAIGVTFAVRITKAMIDAGKEISNISNGFKNLAQNAEGGADGLLKAMKKASKGTIAEIDIMKSANLALQLMGEDVINYLPKMAEIAAGIAKAQGKNTAEVLNDIVVAAGRQSVMILDNLGISSVRAGQLIEEYANKLGKTRDQLSDSEKAAAFFYATMKAGEEVLQRSGGLTEDFGLSVDRLYASIDDLKTKGIQLLLPLLDSLVGILNHVADAANWVVENFKKMKDYIAKNDFLLSILASAPGMQNIAMGMRYKAMAETQKSKQTRPVTQPIKTQGLSTGTTKEVKDYTKELEDAAIRVAEGFEKVRQAAQEGNIEEAAKQMQHLKEQGLLAADANSKFAQSMQQVAYDATIQNYAVDTLSTAFKNLESASRDAVYEMLWGKNGWSNFLKNFKEIVKQLVAEIVYLTVKAMALQAVLSAVGVGGFGGGGVISKTLSKIFERGYIPSYARGKIPAFPTGYVPNDHFLAYIGTKEAVVRKEATQANRDILAWMNTNNGRRYDANSNVVVNITGNVLSKDFIRSQVIPIIQNELRYKGQKTFGVK